ncbi:hypothetical protein GGR34_000593 [Microvirga flocculans]|uniref:Uncharacterized protein n=1 Tax=Microvirga flocculans TaxID=217168 RepID=A0A7W6N758_9HYPH|nr:hypothetical protein [Microvirga flocculans]
MVSDCAGLVYPYPAISEGTKGTAVAFPKPPAQDPGRGARFPGMPFGMRPNES